MVAEIKLDLDRTREYFLKPENLFERTKEYPLVSVGALDRRTHFAFVAIGSNIGDRLQNIHTALKSLAPFCSIIDTSFLYETPPAYVIDQPSFLNAACKVITELSPQDLLTKLKEIEENMGREKTIRFGPRNIDLDIIFYDDAVVQLSNPDIIIPHPRAQERDFVLGPLSDIGGEYIHPVLHATVKDLLKKLPEIRLKKVLPINDKILWHIGERTILMGILNVTPDSFSDGGRFNSVETALAAAKEMVESGVDIIDIGGQSTRPGAEQVSEEEELSRVIPIIQAIRKELSVPISVDTFYSEVAREAVKCGANVVNDVTGGDFDARMLSACAELRVPVILMHMKGNPKTMSSLAQYEDVVKEVKLALEDKVNHAVLKTIYRWHIVLDPGIGFAKNQEQNLELLRRGSELLELGSPLLYGTSRKGFIGNITNQKEPSKRTYGTAATCTAAIQQGASILRVHDVKEMKDVILVSDAIYRSRPQF